MKHQIPTGLDGQPLLPIIDAFKLIISTKLGFKYLIKLLSLLQFEEKKLSNQTTGAALLIYRLPEPDEIY